MKCPKCGKKATNRESNGRTVYYHTHYVDQKGKSVQTICITPTPPTPMSQTAENKVQSNEDGDTGNKDIDLTTKLALHARGNGLIHIDKAESILQSQLSQLREAVDGLLKESSENFKNEMTGTEKEYYYNGESVAYAEVLTLIDNLGNTELNTTT